MTSSAQPPAADLYCPVCGAVIKRIHIWQLSGGDRARICAALPEYAALPAHERFEATRDEFYAWAGRRMLRHVFEKEHS